MRRLILVVGFGLTIALASGAPSAAMTDTPCTGVIGAVTVENVVVPPNAVCKLIGTQVLGNVRVETNATFDATNADIHGNVQSIRAFYTDLYFGTEVGGDVQIKDSAVDTDICGTEIGGDLQFERVGGTLDAARVGETFHPGVTTCVPGQNKVIVHGDFQAYGNLRPVDLVGNEIGGNVQYFQNPSPTPSVISLNQIVGALQCFGNAAVPVGAGNTAATKQGQCAGL